MAAISDDEIRQQLLYHGENYSWEFKLIDFKGDRPTNPRRDDLADELTAFANANGGILLCGVADNGHVQGFSPTQTTAVVKLLVEISTDIVKPPLRIQPQHRKLDGKKFVLVEVPKGDTVYERDGHAFLRVGATKRRMSFDECLRLAQNRGQSRYLRFDKQTVLNTGFHTLNEQLWIPLLSVEGAREPQKGLMNLGVLAEDEFGMVRATVAGVLLCTTTPQEWLPQAVIMATHYRGHDRASGQWNAQVIVGPLNLQIADAVNFVVKNMRVAARKVPEREDIPQYSVDAIFEALVNAVVHRDYSMSSRRIRLSMFKKHLEIDSPGQPPNGMTIKGMETSQSTRNEVIASIFGRMSVGDIPGSSARRYFMERRGDGVSIIRGKTLEITGKLPLYKVVDESNLVLSIPAAKLVLSPSDSTVTVHSNGELMPRVEVLALFPNKTWLRATTDEIGEAKLELYTTHLPITIYAAIPGYTGGIKQEWLPNRGGLLLEINRLPAGGAIILTSNQGVLPGLTGTLNFKQDSYGRNYIYANNIAIDEGRKQPVYFHLGKPLKFTDAYGSELIVTIIDIVGSSILVEYRKVVEPDSSKI